MDDGVVLAVRKCAPPQFEPSDIQETDMTKTHTSTFASIYRLAEVATIAFMLSALPVAAVSLIAQSA
jgi:hypothetical protein